MGIVKIDLHPFSGQTSGNLAFEFVKIDPTERLFENAQWVKELLQVQGVAENQGGRILLSGKISFILHDQCDRCLENFSRVEEVAFEETVTGSGKSEELKIEDDQIDINYLIEDYLMLSFPAQRLCKENCPGLCFHCGCDLNVTKCNCDKEKINPKFEKLAILKRNL